MAPQSFVCQTRHHHHCHLWLGEIIIINIVIIIILLDCEKFKNRHHNFCLSNSPAQHQVSSSCTKAELLSPSVFFSFSHMQIKFTFEAGISSLSRSLLLQSIFPCTVISVNMPTPHFYRKYAHPFSEGSFLKILW